MLNFDLVITFLKGLLQHKKTTLDTRTNQTTLYPDPINKKDPYTWLHQNDQKWFLEQFINLAEPGDLNIVELFYCLEAPIQHMIIHHNYALATGGDCLTFNMVLDLLSAAYCVPLLPGLPTKEAKMTCKVILSGILDNDEE